MDFLFAMSIFSSAAAISHEKGKAREWVTAWIARDDSNGGAATEQGEPQPRVQKMRVPQEKQLQGKPWFAPEFDGLNCFETIVSH